MRAFRSLLAVIVLFAVSLPLIAAEAVGSHEAAARRLVRVTGGGAAGAEAGADAMMATIRGNPELAPYEDVFRAWFKKVFATGDFEGQVATLYMKYFSEKELLELAAFYDTPIGRKALATLPQIMKEAADIGLARGKEHQGELWDMLAAAKAARAPKSQ